MAACLPPLLELALVEPTGVAPLSAALREEDFLQYQEVALNNMQTQTNRQTASQITNKQAPHDRTQTKL